MENKNKPTLKARVVGYAIAGFGIIAVYGIFADFLPDRVYYHNALYVSYGFSTIATVIAYWAYFKKDSAWRANVKGKQRPWVTVLALPPVIFIMSYFGFTAGIPALINDAIATQGSEIYRVESRNSTYSRRRCTGGVKIEHEVIMKNQVCGIPEDLWKQIDAGDSLELQGEKSIVGLRYTQLRLIKRSLTPE